MLSWIEKIIDFLLGRNSGRKKDMTKAETTRVVVDITPMLRNGGTVYCEVDPAPGSGRYVKGGVIKLPRGATYDVEFRIQPGEVEGLQFDPEAPFWSAANACPGAAGNDGQFTDPTYVDPTTASVRATPVGGKNAVHYRLNFNDGSNCDPIIINGGL